MTEAVIRCEERDPAGEQCILPSGHTEGHATAATRASLEQARTVRAAPTSASPPRTQSAVLTMAGGALMVAGALLPWATITSGLGSASIAGTEGDGVLVLGLGALTLLAGFLAFNGSRSALTGATGLGILAGLLIAYTFSNLSGGIEAANGQFVRGSIGIGLWVAGIGAVLAIVAPALRGGGPVPAAAAAPMPVASTSTTGIADELTKLVALRDAGTITPEEFGRERARLLPPPPG